MPSLLRIPWISLGWTPAKSIMSKHLPCLLHFRQVLYCWATREAQILIYTPLNLIFFSSGLGELAGVVQGAEQGEENTVMRSKCLLQQCSKVTNVPMAWEMHWMMDQDALGRILPRQWPAGRGTWGLSHEPQGLVGWGLVGAVCHRVCFQGWWERSALSLSSVPTNACSLLMDTWLPSYRLHFPASPTQSNCMTKLSSM